MDNNEELLKRTTWINTMSSFTESPRKWIALPAGMIYEDTIEIYDIFGDKIVINIKRPGK